MKILVTLPVHDRHKTALKAAAPQAEFFFTPPGEVTDEQLGEVAAVIGNISPSRLRGFENIRWVQLNSAGTDGYPTQSRR